MTPEQTPSWWNDLTIPPKKLARKRLRYALEQTEDERLRNEALDHIRRIRAGRELESADPFSEQAIPRPKPEEAGSTKPKEPFPGDSGPFSLQDPRTPDEFVADVQAGKVQRIDLPERVSAPDETIIRTPERTVVHTTRKLPETPDTAQIPVVRRGRRNNGAIRRSIPDVEVGIPPELVQGAERRQEVIPLSPYSGKPLPTRPGAAIPRHIPQAPVTTAPPMPSGLPEVPDVPMRGPMHMVGAPVPTPEAGRAKAAVKHARSQSEVFAAIVPPTEPATMPFGEVPTKVNPRVPLPYTRMPTLPHITGAAHTASHHGSTVPTPTAPSIHIGPPPLPITSPYTGRMPIGAPPSPPIRKPFAARVPMPRPTAGVPVPKPTAGMPVPRPTAGVPAPVPTAGVPAPVPTASSTTSSMSVLPQSQPPRVQHAPIYGANPGILLLAGMGLVAVNFLGQILGSANSVNSLADLLLHAPTGKTQGIFSKLPANTLGTLLAESALVVFLALVMGNINSFTNFLATGIIALFWLIWLVENGDKLALIWKSITGNIAGITKGGTSRGWTLPSGGF